MAPAVSSRLLVGYLLTILSAAVLLPMLALAGGGFSAELIHRDSPKSPLYDPKSTPSSRIRAAAERSRARADYFREAIRKAKPKEDSSDNFYSEIISNNYEYLMSFSLGTPAKKIIAIADTGSDLIWVQCSPCDECYQQNAPLFNPQKSSTYKPISCKADSCAVLSESFCGTDSLCEYNYGYGDGSVVDGFLATETVGFHSDGGSPVQIPTTIFGCTHQSNGTFDESDAGLVGLGGGKLSLIRQLGSVYKAGKSVSVGNTGSSGLGNIIIDSGTTLTMIDEVTLQSVESNVKRSVNLPQVQDPNGVFSLCFDVSIAGSDASFPDITFQFSGGASVVLHQSNSFLESSQNVLCLAIISSGAPGSGVNIFGNIAQQNFHIGYDLDAQKLTLAPADCSNL
ncbi:hypothetical protein HPP92_022821 [Vanilla planifolia]|uniref:Peptidase A1 domain-containing protein n=1 Tax=Vanilla planifolia TaxID=51239 RepID=A0A835PZ08_VANPL|nr:hypothetical protein HPP92_023111 [Vanilla planifolia]KAG0459693.1 hypothetical protein HPP92_022821 [Vanilla planifolia]